MHWSKSFCLFVCLCLFFFPSNFDSIILTLTFASNVLHVLLANAPSSKTSDIPFTIAFTKNIQTGRN